MQVTVLTRRKEKMIQLMNSHLPTSKGMKKQVLVFAPHSWKIWFDQVLLVNMVMAEKISEM